ncbi:hypothetical protein ABZ869_32570 [Streptomyces sp. NPDC046928]
MRRVVRLDDVVGRSMDWGCTSCHNHCAATVKMVTNAATPLAC